MDKLNPSKLGTKEYWDDFYSLERSNFTENGNDTGECWFSDSGAEEKMVEFLLNEIEDGNLSNDSSMIDLGTGNGRLLFSIRDEGFEGHLTGIDYSEESVEFCKQIAVSEGYHDENSISFKHVDFLNGNEWKSKQQKWTVILDKGTLDAIALSSQLYGTKSGVEQYAHVVKELLTDEPSGLLLITSCNFTQDELISAITKGSRGKLQKWKTLSYPTYEFGGVKGQTICTVAFKKN